MGFENKTALSFFRRGSILLLLVVTKSRDIAKCRTRIPEHLRSFLASKKIQNKSGGKPKRFRTNREMKREEEFEHALMQLESLSEEISELQDELTLVVINNLTPTKDTFLNK